MGARLARGGLAALLAAAAATFVGCGARGHASDAAPAVDVDRHQRSQITVLGPAALVAAVTAPRMQRTDFTPDDGAGEAQARFTSSTNADWTTPFTLATSGAEPLTIRPWLCPLTASALDAASAGLSAIEKRTVELDPAGRFWTNGRFGQPFPSVCSYAPGGNTLGETTALQDGPSLCAQPERAATALTIVAPDGSVSTPETCVARFGAAHQAGFSAQVGLTFTRATKGAGGEAFTLTINHCLASEQLPFDLTASDFVSSTCLAEEGVMRYGGITAKGKPAPNWLQAGTWKVRAASRDHATVHESDLDLSFTAEDGTTYAVKGHVSLPQILY